MNFRERIAAIRQGYESRAMKFDEALRAFETTLQLYGILDLEHPFPEDVREDRFLGLLDVAEEEFPHLGEPPRASLAAAHGLKRCPTCLGDSPRLYNSFRDFGGVTHILDPSRCARCMVAWVRQNLPGYAERPPDPSFTPDSSPVLDMESQEERFFRAYEREMGGFKP